MSVVFAGSKLDGSAQFHCIRVGIARHPAGMSLSCHRDLIVWNKAVELASAVYAASAQLPREERSGLRVHLRRAALAVSSNIALGAARSRRVDFMQCMHEARGSLAELEAQLTIAQRQRWLPTDESLRKRIAEIDRLLQQAIASVGRATLAAHARACNGDSPS